MNKEHTFKLGELCRVTIKNNSNIDTRVAKSLTNSINQMGGIKKDTSKTSPNGLYCPKISGGCYAYVPKRKKAEKADNEE